MTLQEQIAEMLKVGVQTRTTPGTPDWTQYRLSNPDIAARASTLTPEEMARGNWQTQDDWAKFHYGNTGQAEGRVVPTTPGSSTTEFIRSPEYNLGMALQQALAQARSTVASRGLDYGQFAPTIESQLQGILGMIPKGVENPSQFFDPNLASGILSGEENRMRNEFRNQASSIPTSIGMDIFGDTINSLIGSQEEQARGMLDRGRKRGQFNDLGYNAGLGAIGTARQKAMATLQGYGSDILSEYQTRLGGVRDQAMNAASGFNLGNTLDLGRFQSEADRISNEARQFAPGRLLGLVGDQNFFNPNTLKMTAGMAQGATNLRDVGVLESLATRRKADEVGRGLGTQGAF